MNSVEELSYDLKKWLSDLSEARSELIALTKNNPNGFINDIGALLKCSIRLKNCILTQERKIDVFVTASDLPKDSSFFQDHKKIKLEIESLRYKVFNLRAIIGRLHERRRPSSFI